MNRFFILAIVLSLAVSVGAVRTIQLNMQPASEVMLPSTGLTSLNGVPLHAQPTGTAGGSWLPK